MLGVDLRLRSWLGYSVDSKHNNVDKKMAKKRFPMK